jgi:hypothetical protein
MKFELYKDVILKQDVPKYKLKKGDVVTLVEGYERSAKYPEHYAAEIFSPTGKTLGVCTLAVTEIEQMNKNFVYVISARKMKKAS